MKTIEITDEAYRRLVDLSQRLEWNLDRTLLQIIEDAEDLQSEIEIGSARECPITLKP